METARDKMIKARTGLIMSNPFFGSLALRLKMTPRSDIEVTATDGHTLFYNPDVILEMPLEEIRGVIAQLVMHIGLLHHTRRGDRDNKKWQRACDLVVNGILEKCGFVLPNTSHLDHQYDGMSAEHVYSMMPDEPDGPNNGAGAGGGSGENEDGNNKDDVGHVDDSPSSTNKGGSMSQQAAEEAECKQALAQAAHAAKQAGKLPAEMERLIEEVLEAVLPWRNILKRFMTEKSNDNFSWAKGNRRFIARGLYLPSRVSTEAMGPMTVVIDTSGSITQKQLDEFAAEIRDIHADVKPTELIVIYCDARIAHVDRFGPEDELQFELHGGGGTDFRPPFEWLEENMIVPRAFVYLTDGYGPFPEAEPGFPTMWCINNDNVIPPFGEHLRLQAAS